MEVVAAAAVEGESELVSGEEHFTVILQLQALVCRTVELREAIEV